MRIKEAASGDRIVIRDYVKADLEFVTSMWLDGENGKYLSDPTREFVDDVFRKALEDMEDHPEGYYLVIESKETGSPVGSCCMFPDKKKDAWDIGYCIHKKYWNQGYGTEAVSLIKMLVREQGGHEITAEAAKENLASNLLLKKLGFKVKRESEFKKYHMDIRYESYIYGLKL